MDGEIKIERKGERDRKKKNERDTDRREGGREGGARIDKDEICKRNKQVDRKTSFTNVYFLTFSFISKQS